jgi:small GTP-binding protein
LKSGKSCADLAWGDCVSLFQDLKQVKVLVLGKENVGKTTLVKRITGDWGLRNKIKSFTLGKGTRVPTDGIEMKRWEPTDMENTVVYFWDFAGQELYYTTHHFFLSENSINLIVFDCTKSLEENRLLFWLNSIQSMAPGSHIMIIGSRIDRLKDQRKIFSISKKIDVLITKWLEPIPSIRRPKLDTYDWNESTISFWPLSFIRSSNEIEPFYKRF